MWTNIFHDAFPLDWRDSLLFKVKKNFIYLFLEGKTSKNKTPKMTPDFWKSYLQKKSESGSKDQITYRERTSKEVAPL